MVFEARKGRLAYLRGDFALDGEPLEPGRWLTAVGRGAMRPCSVAYLTKWQPLAYWGLFCYRFGIPGIHGKTEAAKGSQEWNDFKSALEGFANDWVTQTNRSAEISLIEASKGGPGALPFKELVERSDRLFARCFRGGDLSTQSRAGGDVAGSNPQESEKRLILTDGAQWATDILNSQVDEQVIAYLFNAEPKAWIRVKPVSADDEDSKLGFTRDVYKNMSGHAVVSAVMANLTNLKQLTKDAGMPVNAGYVDLKDAVQGLAYEFPLLGRAARLALNPITLAVAGVASAFSIWTDRMQAAMEVLGGVQMPDITGSKLEKYDAAASAWERFAKNVRETVEAYNSVLAASERMEKSFDKQAEREKKRLANQEKLDLAALDLRKGQMTSVEYAAEKARIEGKYEQGQMAIEERAEQRKLAERGRRVGNLQIDASRKEAEARGIIVAPEQREADIDRLQKEAVEFATKKQNEAKARLQRLEAMSADAVERAKGTWWYAQTYGPETKGPEARKLERDNIERWQVPIDRYGNWEQSKVGRQRRRTRRDELLEAAAGERGEAYTTSRNLAVDNYEFNQDRAVNRETAAVNRYSRSAGVVASGTALENELRQGEKPPAP